MKKYIMFDVGGTGVKYATLGERGEMLTPPRIFPSPSLKRAEEVFSCFADVISSDVSGIGMAWPGPFDYGRGISLMTGLGKYQSIYGLDVGEGIRRALKRDDLDIRFDHDVAAFLKGYVREESLTDARVLALAIGTGAGSAFCVNGRCVGSEEMGVPENGWIYSMPFRDAAIEDWISSKGIRRLSLKYFKAEKDGRELYEMAALGDEKAIALWLEFGAIIREGIMPFIRSFMPTDIVFGGMISKAWNYFSPGFIDDFREKGVRTHVTFESDRYVFSGLYTLFGGLNG